MIQCEQCSAEFLPICADKPVDAMHKIKYNILNQFVRTADLYNW